MRKWTVREVSELIEASGILKRKLPEDAVAALMAKGAVKSYPKGALMLQRGEQNPRFFVLLSGTARLVAHTPQGREFVSIFIQPGNFWGVHPCLDDVAESHDALAQTDVEVLSVPGRHLRGLMWENRDIQETMVSFLCQRLRLSIDVAEQFATWPPRARLAWRVLAMGDSHGIQADHRADIEVQMSQESLASMINLSRQRTNILLKEMEREGLLEINYGRLRILDPDRLHAILDDV